MGNQEGTPWLWIIALLMSATLTVLKIAGIGTFSWWAAMAPMLVIAGLWVVLILFALILKMWADTSRY